MKLGCCVNMLASTDTQIGIEHIATLSELGYDYLELPLAQITALPECKFKETYKQTKGIPIEACNNFFPANIRLTGENVDRSVISEYVKRATERALQMGVKIIVLGSAGAKNIPVGFPYNEAREQFIALLYHLQSVIAPLGLTIVLEPLNTKESNFILTLDEAIAMAKEADCDNIKVLADYYHMRMENEDITVIKNAGEDLRHIHIAAKHGRTFPRENDGEDYETFFATLKTIGYDARISIEAYSDNVISDGSNSIRFLRRLMN